MSNKAFEKYWKYSYSSHKIHWHTGKPFRLERRERELIAWRAWHAAETALRKQFGIKWINSKWQIKEINDD